MKGKKAKGLFLCLGFCIAAGSLFITNMSAQAQTVYGKYGYVNGVMEGNVGRATLRNTSSTTRYGTVTIYQCDANGNNVTYLISAGRALDSDSYVAAIKKVTKAKAYALASLRKNAASDSAVVDNINTCWLE